MKILILPSNYPYPSYPLAGVFNEKCVVALKELCDHIEVLVPRPFIPPFLALLPKWKAYCEIADYEKRQGINIHRPPIFQIPKIGSAFWSDYGAYLCYRQYVRKLHRQAKFDVILSFNLYGAGGLAWRIGKDLGIPACGWAGGNEVRVSASSSSGKVVALALKNLDLVFYQSFELLEQAARLINKSPEDMSSDKHIVLPRGTIIPSLLYREKVRKNIRARWKISNNEIVVLNLGRVTKEKGIFELLDTISVSSFLDRRITCILVGSVPAFDDSVIVKRKLEKDPILRERVKIFPACNHEEIWDILSGADIFAFTSQKEGMPNSLLEAMALGLPAIAFAIPAIEELDAGTCSLIKVPPFNSKLFAEAILKLSCSPENRKAIGDKGRMHVIKKFNINKNMSRVIGEMIKVINN